MPSVRNPNVTGIAAVITARDRRDDAHPADAEAAVQQREASCAEDAARDRDRQVQRSHRRLADHGEQIGSPMARLASWLPNRTPSTGARRLASPPPKSAESPARRGEERQRDDGERTGR